MTLKAYETCNVNYRFETERRLKVTGRNVCCM